ncbi:MAG: hypothetical protein KBD78_04645 [Oligoflexales bacterium]|nr:hypothetical protein [Oligoflexales bacterium]
MNLKLNQKTKLIHFKYEALAYTYQTNSHACKLNRQRPTTQNCIAYTTAAYTKHLPLTRALRHPECCVILSECEGSKDY